MGSFLVQCLLPAMITSSPKFQRKKIIVTLVIIFIISVVIFFYRNSPPVRYMQGVVQTIFSYPKSLLYSIGKNGGKDDSVLLKKNQELEKKLVAYEILRQDNIALKSQFDVSGETSRNLTAAKIIGFQGDNKTPHEFIINVGEKDKVKKGMTVIFQNYFIGKVETVSRNLSVVITPFNSKFRVLARFPETNADGILVGRDDLMLFDGVVITDQLKKDGIVVTKGEVDKSGVGVVPDLIIGKIASISKNETAPFQSAQITPMITFEKLSNVFVISQM